MFHKRVSKSKPARRALLDDDHDEAPKNDVANSAAESPSTLATKLKDRAKKSRPKSRLSFGGPEDEESAEPVFQVKKSRLSQQSAKSSKQSQSILDISISSTASSSGPTYDAAHLDELRASTRKAPRPAVENDSYDADMSMSVDDVQEVTMSIVDEEQPAGTAIHTESHIKQAKERRERARKAPGEEDYISLSLTTRSDEKGPHPSSRLVREDDELGEGDDEYSEFTSAQERIALGKKSRKVEAQKRRADIENMIAEADFDDEEAEWEEAQLKRGGHLGGTSSSTTKHKLEYKPAPIPPATSIPSLGTAVDQLAQQLAILTASHAANVSAMASTAQERDMLDRQESEMREMVTRAEEKRAWFSSFNDWVEAVASFLDEKFPLVEKLEDEHISFLQERYEMLRKRRMDDDRDDLSLFFGTPPTPIPENESENDEFGRARPGVEERRAERRNDRLARQQRRARQRGEEEGYSTDEELPPADNAAYQSALQGLEDKRAEVLADVKAKEFLDPGQGRWSEWRERYTDSYVGAYGGLGVVSVWEFWARLEMARWDCIEDLNSLDSFKWYRGLYVYCRPDGQELGPEGDLVASMITTAVIPRLAKVLEGGALDVYSSKHIRRVVDLTEEVEASVESVEDGQIKKQVLYKAVQTCFDRAVADVQTLQSAQGSGMSGFNPDGLPARKRYLARRLKLLRNLLRWRKHIGDTYGVGRTVEVLLEDVMLPVANSGWEVGGEDVMRQVLATLPEELVPQVLRTRLAIQ
ncbi:hypothetical protein CYLTODRAFT_494369 [Cylindrobasidium torrendii FP15055 ss-10]|uniref:GCFC-domain-containing protein n=1 Tax=Cylindrobasidium torrendii FP15055 ss-10 TaxID=1314674 RepID=A0A0D7AXA8_9AGAR|nr:hypothetical protein CYLTODRAFT_494369 [Cylindrobasidium torrendii FP15055 ss-10]